MRRVLTALTMTGALAASWAPAEVVERIVAKVNGEVITKTQLDREYQNLVERLGPAPTPEEEQRRATELKNQVLEGMVDNLLVLQIAQERGLRVPPRYFEEWKAGLMKEMKIESEEEFLRQVEIQGLTMDDLRKQFEEGVLVQEVRRMEVETKISVDRPEIDKYYQDHIRDYSEPARVRLREIVVRFEEGGEEAARQKAARLLQDIRQGADFAEVARLHSESASREAGGDLGFFEQGELTEPLAEVAFKMGPGEVSDLIRIGTSYYIIRIEEKIEEKTKPLEDVNKEIAESIYQEKLQDRTKKYMRELRERAIIEIKL